MKKIFLLVVIVFIVNSCRKKEDVIIKNEIKTNKGLVILVSNPEKIKTNIGSGIIAQSFSKLNIDSEKKRDTIKIKLKDYRKLYIKNQFSFKVAYCEVNDTLVLKISKENLQINYQNRSLKKYDTIPLTDIYLYNAQKEILAYNKMFQKFYSKNTKTNRMELVLNEIEKNTSAFKKLDSLAENKLKKKELILKSLLKSDLISYPNYYGELSNLNYKYYSSLLDNYQLTNDDYYKNRINNLYFKNNDALENAFMSYGYMNLYIAKIILKQKTAYNLDYAKAFDKLPNYFQNNHLKFFREFCFNQIATNSGEFIEIRNYFNKFKAIYSTDTTTINSLKKRYSVNSKKTEYKKSNVYILNSENDEITLSEITKKYIGKLIYVDFWASWCAPCIAEMPASKTLQKEYKGKDVVFIYISTDKDKNAWINASENLNIKNEFNFLATNYPNSNFYNSLKLYAIPRYIIFDKKGKLIHQNAPRPSSIQIKSLFDKLLKKNN